MAITIAETMIAIVILCCVVTSSAKDYTVGDATGWTTSYDYSTWTGGKTFTIGDTLVFIYGGLHNVAEVSPSDYSSCTASNAITSDSSGATKVALKTTGTHYFICGTPGHCSQGMKLSVKVGGSAAATPDSPATTTPSSTTTPTSTSTPTTTTSTSSHSSSGALSPSTILVLTGVALLKFVVSLGS